MKWLKKQQHLGRKNKILEKSQIKKTKVRIKSNEVKILSSPCPNKTCVQSAPLKKVGDWNACLPNQVFVYIKEK